MSLILNELQQEKKVSPIQLDELNRELSEINDIEEQIILDEKIISTKEFELDRISAQLEVIEKENFQSEIFIRNSHEWVKRERRLRMCKELVLDLLLGIEKNRVKKRTKEVGMMKAVAIQEFQSLQMYLKEFEELECVTKNEMRKVVRKIKGNSLEKMHLNSGK